MALGVIVILIGLFLFTGYRMDENPPEALYPLSIICWLIGGVIFVGALFGFQSGKTEQQTSSSNVQEETSTKASIPEQIEQLSKLKEQGVLSEAEFEEKKKELLSRM